jgi:hypothetical protein
MTLVTRLTSNRNNSTVCCTPPAQLINLLYCNGARMASELLLDGSKLTRRDYHIK